MADVSPQGPSADDLHRLNVVALFYRQAAAIADQPPPMSSMAILALHDASELMLRTIADSRGVTLPQEFRGAWTAIRRDAGLDLPFQGRMDALNSARVALKHKGQLQTDDTIRRSVIHVDEFLVTSCQMAFGLDFESIDLVDLVESPSVRARLRSARQALSQEDTNLAAAHVALAFHDLVEDPFRSGTQAARLPLRGAWRAGLRIGGINLPVRNESDDPRIPRLGAALDTAVGAISDLQGRMRMHELGIDPKEYARFAMRMPVLKLTSEDTYSAVFQPGVTLSREHVVSALEFVIGTSLRLARTPAAKKLPPGIYTSTEIPIPPLESGTGDSPEGTGAPSCDGGGAA